MPARQKIIDQVLVQDKCFASKKVEQFASDFLRELPYEDVKNIDYPDLARAVLDHWSLSKDRKPEEIRVEMGTETVSRKSIDRSKTVINIASDDMAFTINSVSSELTQLGYKMDRFLHPRILTEAEKKKVGEKDGKRPGTSHLHIVLDTLLVEEDRQSLKKKLTSILKDVQLANKDWLKMLDVLKGTMDDMRANEKAFSKTAVEEHVNFLNYLYEDNFTLLASCEFDLRKEAGEPKKKLGLFRKTYDGGFLDFEHEGVPFWNNPGNPGNSPLIVTKLRELASVHRIVPMDAVSVTIFDKKGRPEKERLFIGLFTSVTYSRSIQDVPYLRQKTDAIVKQSGFMPGGHDYKALSHILEKFPRDELFQIDEDKLAKTAMEIMRLQQQPRIALFARNNPFNNLFSCLVYFPREQFDTRLRLKVQHILERELDAQAQDFFTTMDDSMLARVLFIFCARQQVTETVDIAAVEKKIRAECRPWAERFAEASDEMFEDQDYCAKIIRNYQNAFPVEYQERIHPKHSLYDVKKIEQALDSRGGLSFDIYRSSGQSAKQLQLKVYRASKLIPLSDILPILENMGLRVTGERPYEVKVGPNEKVVWIHDFMMEYTDPTISVDLKSTKKLFEDALIRIWFDEADNDSLNKLILSSGMTWREVSILRAYIRYLHQIGYTFSLRYMERSVTENPKISRQIVDFFKAWHDPANARGAKEKATGALVALDHAFDEVESLDHDRILRRIADVVDATLRTNYFQTDKKGQPKPYLSIKLDSRRIKGLPSPKPYREIFVYSPRVEGIHLRGDKIARGGIRWSDRLEDYRTEVLGLMKAQLVKNSIIVPMGAKGGFVVKKTPTNASREQFQKEGIECYKTFISGLLDITDNIVNDKVVPPKDVFRRDEDDTYLVVAADKGTATFSDIANHLSKQYGFWMGDAFASGGAEGYDHKKMGITAKGAWESVKRHFQELNHNIQAKPFRVVGVGDMGGDVFGNGMLLSDQIMLVAAFNHRHIFIDPDPSPRKSWKERKRLFDNILGWDQYDQKILSKGGRVYERSAKSLTLTPEIQKLTGLSEKTITPQDLIRAILTMQTDLLWFGGIGTYIKSSAQSHEDVGDKGNDAVRVDAKDIRAKVIGEGANLAVTQEARVEAALKGIRLNADFIDNSGGVDCSDHEVNIKILMNDLMKQKGNKKLGMKARNKMLEDMTDNVSSLVLKNNYQQALAVSLMELQSFENLNMHRQFISDLENMGLLERQNVALPDDEELIVRFGQGKGLTRPELSLIQAYAKILFTQDLLESDIPDSKNMERFLVQYFPKALQNKYEKQIISHSLKREIIATEIANGLTNRMGPTFVKFRMAKTGASSDAVAKAYIIVREAFELDLLWNQIEQLDYKVPAMVQLNAMRDISQLVEREVTWFLTRLGRPPKIDDDIPKVQKGIRKLKPELQNVVTPSMQNMIKRNRDAAVSEGLPADLAKEIALLPMLAASCDIIKISNTLEEDLLSVASVFFQAGEFFHFDWLRNQAKYMQAEDKWDAEAKDGLIDQMHSCQAGLTMRIIQDRKNGLITTQNSQELFPAWVDMNKKKVDLIQELVSDMRNASGIDVAMLLIAEQRLRSMYGG